MILKIVLLIIAIPIIIIIIAAGIHIIPLPYTLEHSRDLIGAVITGIILFLYLLSITFYLIYSFKIMGRKFDRTLEELSLKKQDFRYFGRHYKGIIKNRKITIEYFPPKVIQRALLNISLSGDLNIEAAVSKKTPLLFDKVLKNSIKMLEYGFNVYSAGGERIFRIFSDNNFLEILNNILKSGRGGHILQIYFYKEKLYLRSRFSNIDQEVIKIYINSLEDLAEIIENK